MRKYLFLLFVLCCRLSMAADDDYILRVELNDGTKNDYVLAERPQIQFENGNTVFLCKGISTTYDRSNIKRFTFVRKETGINSLKAGDTRISYFGGDLLTVKSVNKQQIRVYSIDGREWQVSIDSKGQRQDVSLAGLPGGYYIINIGKNQSIKILRK